MRPGQAKAFEKRNLLTIKAHEDNLQRSTGMQDAFRVGSNRILTLLLDLSGPEKK